MFKAVWIILTTRCEDADRIAALARRGGAAWYEKLGAKLHRGLCAGCRHAYARMQQLDHLLDDLTRKEADEAQPAASNEGLSSGARDRLRQALNKNRHS